MGAFVGRPCSAAANGGKRGDRTRAGFVRRRGSGANPINDYTIPPAHS